MQSLYRQKNAEVFSMNEIAESVQQYHTFCQTACFNYVLVKSISGF